MKNTIPSFLFILKERLRGKNFLHEFYFKSKKTIDIGCGEGEFLALNKKFIRGVDLNESVIKKLADEGFSVKVASADRLPYEDEEFEMAHCRNVIEHLAPKTAHGMLCEASRVLKKGGMLVLGSEVMTKKFWGTFGHIRPYPPGSVRKLLRADGREEFEPISSLEWEGVFYLGDYFSNRMLYFFSALLGYYTPLFRREYFLVLRKK
ncbi:MAG: class I SAM-dependent methyltransferase [Patescibacteria group bacterium]|nr:methyltransferase domain-containing protein [Patescibacteria group bacterium]MDE1988292.1 class I SAM-dependent methyltransferase [Patescibacteria group bacterium]MDE2218058.1 class I SAM-dependent methyltransferase [Patescibacteria group bacterium]